MFDVIIPAAGNSTRFQGAKNKLLYKISDKTILECAVLPFLSVDGLNKIIIPTSKELKDDIKNLFNDDRIIIVDGGDTRTNSVKNALSYVTAEYVLIHDGARPYVTCDLIKNILEGAKCGAAVPLIPLSDSVVDISGGYTPKNRDDLKLVQTPQGFKTSLIKECYASIDKAYSDDIQVYLTKYSDIAKINGDIENKKITYSRDIIKSVCRTGAGFDTHKLVEGRKLILGGVEIPFEKGLLGHSDADVLIHSIMDAILSAAGLPDIGHFFPDNDKKYEGISSLILLKEVYEKLTNEGYVVNNISSTLLAEKPKLSAYRDDMRKAISDILNMDVENVGISFTTTEGMYLEGQGLAMSAISYVSIVRQ